VTVAKKLLVKRNTECSLDYARITERKMGSDSAFGEPFYKENERDFPEDFKHENGNYECKCSYCGLTFIGHKRRVICRVCEMKGSKEMKFDNDRVKTFKDAIKGTVATKEYGYLANTIEELKSLVTNNTNLPVQLLYIEMDNCFVTRDILYHDQKFQYFYPIHKKYIYIITSNLGFTEKILASTMLEALSMRDDEGEVVSCVRSK